MDLGPAGWRVAVEGAGPLAAECLAALACEGESLVEEVPCDLLKA